MKLDGVDSMWHENDFDYHAGPGVLGPGARGEIGNAPGPIPRHLRLLWKTPDGKRHEATVAVAEKVPDAAHFSGTVWLKITKSGVKVVPLTDSQMLRMAEKSQPYP
ncbi:MAG TPA: hypothetical protein VN541_00915 [Tepidisphaeraceae bacterium]|nr:hypothetical protein [Tepidisphaeraceae bacterium]